GYIVVGKSESTDGDIDNNHGGDDAWLAKFNATGDLSWQRSYGGSMYEEANDVIELADGSLVVIGVMSSSDGDVTGFPPMFQGGDMWFFKLDATGNIINQAAYGGDTSEVGISIIQTSDGGFIATGMSGAANGDVTQNFGGLDFWVVKVDSNLDLEWQKSLG